MHPPEPVAAAADLADGRPDARLSDDISRRIRSASKLGYAETLCRFLRVAAVVFVLFGAIEVLAELQQPSGRALWALLLIRLFYGGFLGALSLLAEPARRPASRRLLAIDAASHLAGGAMLGAFAALAPLYEAALYLGGVSTLVFARCLMVRSRWWQALIGSLSAWAAAAVCYAGAAPAPLEPAMLFSTLVILLANLALAIYGARRMEQLFSDAIRARSQDRYRLGGELGRGGFGIVYRAWDRHLGRACAVKVLTAPGGDGDALDTFEDEIRAMLRVRSPHVVQVYDVGRTDEGRPYYAMELLDGRDLGTIVRREGPLGLRRALEVAAQCCAGLAAAHDADVVHRDIKPENIVVCGAPPDEHAKVLDFGLARFVDAPGGRPEGLTGTPGYLAPERARGEAGGEAADVYGLGATLYFALTGHELFEGDAPLTRVVRQTAEDAPVPSDLRPDLPPAVDAIVTRCLARAPDARFPGMGPLRRALVRVRRELDADRDRPDRAG